MIEEYFLKLENALRDFPNIRSYSLNKKIYNNRQGSISGKLFSRTDTFLNLQKW